MVRRKRRNARGRRKSVTVVNPRRRRRSVAVRSNRRRAALSLNPRRRRRRAVANPRRRNGRRRRSRNPSVVGIAKGGFWVGLGAAATNIVAGYIPIGGGGWMDVLKQLAASFVVGWLAERIPFIGGANAQLMTYGGFGGTAWSAVNMALSGASGFLTGGGTASQQPGMAGYFGDITTYPPGALNGYEGMGDIVNAPEWYGDAAMRQG